MCKFLCFLLLPFSAHAFNIDSMVKYYNKDNFFILTGDKKETREYIYTTITELTVSNGKDVERELLSSDVARWPIIAEPSEILLNDGEQVKVKIEKNHVDSNEDRIFGITFTPDLISNKGDKNYNIGFGYKVWMIVPGKQKIQGDMSVMRGASLGDFIISNKTNKVVEVDVNYCKDASATKSCRGQLVIRPRADKKISLGIRAGKAEFSFYIGGDKTNPLKIVKL